MVWGPGGVGPQGEPCHRGHELSPRSGLLEGTGRGQGQRRSDSCCSALMRSLQAQQLAVGKQAQGDGAVARGAAPGAPLVLAHCCGSCVIPCPIHRTLQDSRAARIGLMRTQHGRALGGQMAPERIWSSSGDLEH